jgi:drug/metabolite transporter (DMT)-like permease
METSRPTRPPLPLILFAYGAIYLVWGSTYLAIRFVVETIPPFLSGGVRFLLAGGLLYLFARPRSPRPEPRHWVGAFRVAFFSFLLAFGAVNWAQRTVPSGITALLVASEPLCFLLMDWLLFRGRRPTGRQGLALALGFAGTALLILLDPKAPLSGGGNYLLSAGVILASSLAWVYGSLLTRRVESSPNPFLGSGMQMLAGGLLLLALSGITGEWHRAAAFSPRSLAALAYLVVFGSILTYTAFIWLLRFEPVSRVATHAFVNPVIAVLLGWAIGGERIGIGLALAGALIVSSVALETTTPAAAPGESGEGLSRPAADSLPD